MVVAILRVTVKDGLRKGKELKCSHLSVTSSALMGCFFVWHLRTQLRPLAFLSASTETLLSFHVSKMQTGESLLLNLSGEEFNLSVEEFNLSLKDFNLIINKDIKVKFLGNNVGILSLEITT